MELSRSFKDIILERDLLRKAQRNENSASRTSGSHEPRKAM